MPEFVLKLVLSIVFVLLGGVFSGLSLGLMGESLSEISGTANSVRRRKLISPSASGLDQVNLKVLAASGSPQDRADARRVLSLLSHGRHFVLVCLLLSNVIVNETLREQDARAFIPRPLSFCLTADANA